jgi:hypothetical protein
MSSFDTEQTNFDNWTARSEISESAKRSADATNRSEDDWAHMSWTLAETLRPFAEARLAVIAALRQWVNVENPPSHRDGGNDGILCPAQ